MARLQAAGLLDSERLSCFIAALQPAVRSVPGELAELREARASVATFGMSDHARSVQQGMFAGDVTNAAARQRASDLRHVRSLESLGLQQAATSLRWHSAELAARAEDIALIVVRAPEAQATWSDEEAQILIEYADLMAERPNGTGDSSPRILEIQDSHPHVMEAYAAMLLNLYGDADLGCSAPD